MNEQNTSGPAISDNLLDLLVDGELGADEYRALLDRLGQEPDGWRRCALAFLEAQALRCEMGEKPVEACRERPLWRSAPDADPRNAAEGVPYRREWLRRRIVHSHLSLLGMAASFLVAFGIGWLARPLWGTAAGPAGYVAVEQAPGMMPAVATQDTDAEGASNAGLPPPWEMVTLSVPEAGKPEGRSIRLPAIERQRVDESWFDALPKAVSPAVLQALRRSGHEVRQRRELLPVPMNDGRQLIVPVDQVDVRYVGAKAFQ